MGARGAVPHPNPPDEGQTVRMRRDQPRLNAEVRIDDPVEPPAARHSWSKQAREMYRALKESGQTAHFEPSDWEWARQYAEFMTDLETISFADRAKWMYDRLDAWADELGVTHASRMRMRIEVKREEAAPPNAPPENVVDIKSRLEALR